MDYFSILNLNKEPFSNSPDPDFFFQSRQHVGCLQKVELSLRLRRGLNVVIGDVGTGKTTLCRQLIRRFDKDEESETYLILDPYFSSPSEFLAAIAEMFEGAEISSDMDEWHVKEIIKRSIFRKGVDEKKTVILIVDEGQKIPVFCLEILREFLNYETNEYKLLQIVIFAQNEFKQTLEEHENFADRINLYHILGPLNFRDTRLMIQFRLRQSSKDAKAPDLFNYFALRAIYRATGGYPRKIINLCHQCILAMIIQNRTGIGWVMVRSCVKRRISKPPKKVSWGLATALAGVAVIALVAGLAPEMMKIPVTRQEPPVSSKADFQKPSLHVAVSEAKNQANTEKVQTSSDPLSRMSLEKSLSETVEQPTPQQAVAGSVDLASGGQKRPEPGGEAVADADSAALRIPESEAEMSADADDSKQDVPETKIEESADIVQTQRAPGSEINRFGDVGSTKPSMPDPEIEELALSVQQSVVETDPEASRDKIVLKDRLPLLLGQVALREGESLWRLIEKVYGVFTYRYFILVKRLNPHIANPDHVEVGQVISLPAVPEKSKPLPMGVWWVKVGEEETLEAAIDLLRSYSDNAHPIRLIPYWNERHGLRFAVFLKEYFFDETSAGNQLAELIPSMAKEGKILSSWDEDTVLFADPLLGRGY